MGTTLYPSPTHVPSHATLFFLQSPSRSNSGNAVAAKGAWKESMWGCFRYGCCHPSLCHACCCLPLAAAQVMTRLHLNGWGHPAAVTTLSSARTATSAVGLATKSVFATLLLLVASFWITRLFLLLIIAILDPNVDSPEWIQPGAGYYFFCAVDDLLALAYFLVSVFLVRNVRRAVRNKYSIPEGGSCPAGCEDTCCSMFCGACVASQLLRQTADYDSTPARCCTENGLPYSVGGGASLSPSNNNNSPSRPPTASSVVEMV
jgi:hypothetical protein